MAASVIKENLYQSQEDLSITYYIEINPPKKKTDTQPIPNV